MNKRMLQILTTIALSAMLWGCQTTNGSAGGDHRQDAAARQTERDVAESDQKPKKPMDAVSPQGQEVIDR